MKLGNGENQRDVGWRPTRLDGGSLERMEGVGWNLGG